MLTTTPQCCYLFFFFGKITIPEDGNFHSHYCENLTSQFTYDKENMQDNGPTHQQQLGINFSFEICFSIQL